MAQVSNNVMLQTHRVTVLGGFDLMHRLNGVGVTAGTVHWFSSSCTPQGQSTAERILWKLKRRL